MKKFIVSFFITVISILPLTAQSGTKYDINGYWFAYDAEGNRNKSIDLYIFYNEDLEEYYAQYNYWTELPFRDDGSSDWSEEKVLMTRKSIIIFSSDSTFSFPVYTIYQSRYKGSQVTVRHDGYELQLRFIPSKNKMVGHGKKTRVYDAMGNHHYKSVSEALEHGHGTVGIDCSGDCGTIEVIYRRR